MSPHRLLIFLLGTSTLALGCGSSIFPRIIVRMVEHESDTLQTVAHKVAQPVLPDVGLSVLWVGHACTLIQIHDKVFLTDPSFSHTVGMVSNRVVEPGIDPSTLSHVDYVLVSHIHFDHLNYTSLNEVPKQGKLLIPEGAAEYTPEFGFEETREMKCWDVLEEQGVRITAVPAKHFGGRYGFDMLWGMDRCFTGYVIQYAGKTVYFAGDTGYRDSLFTEIGRRFPVDVALIPIAPIEPREMMSRVHLDPLQAVRAFEELGARLMIPIHHRTFYQGLEPQITFAEDGLRKIVQEKKLQDRIAILQVGERKIVQQ
ncbi:MAG TPA: MBL fold metallo-hydrolase [Bacteroidota bacterium]|nr:MBL fold metallo-hydrolase [Bacteroidota bacterium]